MDEIIDMKKYTSDGALLLQVIKSKFIDHNFLERSKYPNRTIKNELLPDDNIIKALYIELIASYYCCMLNAAVSVGNELLEYMTKKKYTETFNLEKYPEGKKWAKSITELKTKFKGDKNNDRLLKLLDEINRVREKYRNSQNHGNLFQLINDCEIGDIDMMTGKITKRKFRERNYK